MNNSTNKKHTFLFRFVTTLVFSLLLLNNLAISYPKKQDFIARVFKTLYTIFFDSGERSYSLKSGSRTYTTLTCSGGDPTCPPPPPKP